VISLSRAERTIRDGNFGAGVIDAITSDPTALRAGRIASARALQASLRARVGYGHAPAPILTSGASQHKLAKNSLPSFGLMLVSERGMMVPAAKDIRDAFNLTGAYNLCVMASDGCASACLRFAGNSGMPVAQKAQLVRTAFLLAHPYDTGLIIGAELRAALRNNDAINLRLNTTSDIRWEIIAPDMITALTAAGVNLYDYTAYSPADRLPSPAYHLTYSAKEPSHTPDAYLAGILAGGENVAVPFTTGRGEALPATFLGFPVIDGDKSDERRNDPAGPNGTGVVVGLRAKGHLWKRAGGNDAGFIRPAVVTPSGNV
jgi:hypothetical protein